MIIEHGTPEQFKLIALSIVDRNSSCICGTCGRRGYHDWWLQQGNAGWVCICARCAERYTENKDGVVKYSGYCAGAPMFEPEVDAITHIHYDP